MRTDKKNHDNDFPVKWENPDDADMLWLLDETHHPHPVAPLDFSVIIESISEGYNRASVFYENPVRLLYRHVNTYAYLGAVSHGDKEKEEILIKKSVKNVRHVMPELDELWKSVWLPEIKNKLAWWEAFDLRGASSPDLAEHWRETADNVKRVWEIHYLLMIPMRLAIHLFEEMHNDLFPAKEGTGAYELLGGRNKFVEAEEKLWELGRKAANSDEVKKALSSSDSWEHISDNLKGSSAGTEFSESFQDYLNEYGRISYNLLLSKPFQTEDPRSVIRLLRHYMTLPDKDNPGDEFRRCEKAREIHIKNTREGLSVFPKPVASEFESLFKITQAAYPLMTEHTYWIENMATFRARTVALETGRRLAEKGCADMADDIFHLTAEELQQAVENLPGRTELQDMIRERKRAEQHFSGIKPPRFLGLPPSSPRPENPIAMSTLKSYGSISPFSPDTSQKELGGGPASSGSVTGRARVVTELENADRLRPGDILVTKFTLPPWTHLFALIGGIVTDSGGILSHAAIVAREYGIPAVVGTGIATSVIKDGQTVEVDGDKGIVRIKSENTDQQITDTKQMTGSER